MSCQITQVSNYTNPVPEWLLAGSIRSDGKVEHPQFFAWPIGSMYGIYANIWGILMVNVTIYGIHGSYGWCQ